MLSILFDGRRRSVWFIIGSIALLMNAFALYLQHIVGLEPCVKCIDQRIALYLVSIMAFLTSAIKPLGVSFNVFKQFTFAALFYASYLSIDHYLLTIDPNPFAMSCSLEPNLPSWLPLHHWIPELFSAHGMCGETKMKLLGMGLVGWTMIGCASLTAYALAGILNLYRLFSK